MSKKGKKKEAFVFTSPKSSEAFKLALREAVREKGAMLYEDTEAGFDLGIERGGHSGGYWYVATLTETEDGTEMRGRSSTAVFTETAATARQPNVRRFRKSSLSPSWL